MVFRANMMLKGNKFNYYCEYKTEQYSIMYFFFFFWLQDSKKMKIIPEYVS